MPRAVQLRCVSIGTFCGAVSQSYGPHPGSSSHASHDSQLLVRRDWEYKLAERSCVRVSVKENP